MAERVFTFPTTAAGQVEQRNVTESTNRTARAIARHAAKLRATRGNRGGCSAVRCLRREDIGQCVASTLLTFSSKLATKYDLTPQQLAVAIVVAQMQLLAAGAAGVIVGKDASEARMVEKIEELVRGIQAVIGAALEIPK